MQRHAKAFEADIDHYFPRYDLRDLWRPRGGASGLTWRKLATLFDWLPGESATKTAIRDAIDDDTLAELSRREPVGYGTWSHDTLRLAALEDAINRLTAVTVWLAGDRKQPPKLPDPVRRPGVARRRPRITEADRCYLRHLRANRGRLPDGLKFVQVK